MTDKDEIQDALSNCLDELSDASEALYNVKELDFDVALWHEQIESLYEVMFKRYEEL